MTRGLRTSRLSPQDGARIRALSWKVAGLERQISAEQVRPLPDQARLTELKRRKLLLKDEMKSIYSRRNQSDDAATTERSPSNEATRRNA